MDDKLLNDCNMSKDLQRNINPCETYIEPKSLFKEHELLFNRRLTDEEKEAINNIIHNRSDLEDMTIYINSIKDLLKKQNCLENQKETVIHENDTYENNFEKNIRIFFDDDESMFVVIINEGEIKFSASDFDDVKQCLKSYIDNLDI